MAATAAVRDVAAAIKQRGAATTAQIADDLGLSYETARTHVATLAELAFVESERSQPAGAGRPVSLWRLTRAGEHLFPKHYDSLATTLLDTMASLSGAEELRRILSALVDQKVAAWAPALAGLTTDDRLEALKAIYTDDDPHISVEHDERGPMLIERNCPFLDVAHHHPALCGLTVNTLSRLLGVKVVREATFQAGDGRCVFRLTDEAVEPDVYLIEG